jgi:hypothetical protein
MLKFKKYNKMNENKNNFNSDLNDLINKATIYIQKCIKENGIKSEFYSNDIVLKIENDNLKFNLGKHHINEISINYLIDENGKKYMYEFIYPNQLLMIADSF